MVFLDGEKSVYCAELIVELSHLVKRSVVTITEVKTYRQ